jgi:ABC-type lipoprotein release transport system permease subunit
MMLGQGLMLATVGAVLGLAAAVDVTRFLETMLFEVKPLDVQIYLGVAMLLTVVTVLATSVPGRRAAVLDPARVLKTD